METLAASSGDRSCWVADTVLGPFEIDIVVTRAGRAVILLSQVAVGAADSDLTEQLQRTMVDRA